MNTPTTVAPRLDLLPFWTINAGLDVPRLCHQLEEMQRSGFDGAVWHPRFYPDNPPYLSTDYFAILSKVILHAKSLGMKFWLYDENGWPSGIAGGILPRRFPDFRTIWLTTIRGDAGTAANPACSFDLNGERVHLCPQRGIGLDYLNPAAVRKFFELALDSHRDGLTPEAFDYIDAVFTDEPVLGWVEEPAPPLGIVPWTPALPDLWRDRFGDDLVSQLPLLFRRETGSAEFRIRFREFLTDQFVAAFFAPYNRWCAEHGKRFTGHVKGEEHPLFQVPLNGSCHQLFQHLALPGIDTLERHPHHNFYARQVASAARQFGDGQAMAECFGGSGWGVEPQHLLNYLGWLAGNGITTFVLHLYHYHLNSAAVRDWPPSIPNHLTWRDAFPAVIRELRQRTAAPSSHPDGAGLLVVAPQRAIMAEYEPWELSAFDIHKCARYADSPAARLNRTFLDLLASLDRNGVSYHLCDERTLEQHGRNVSSSGLQIGKVMYRQVLASADCRFTPTGVALVHPYRVEPEHVMSAPATTVTATTPHVAETSVPVWRVGVVPVNEFVLEVVPGVHGEDGTAYFTIADPGLLTFPLQLVLLDETQCLTCNAQPLTPQATADGLTVDLTDKLVAGNNLIHWTGGRTADGGPLSLFLRGHFAVKSQTPFTDGPNTTRRTAGPFLLTTLPKTVDATDLVADGFPFCREPVRLVAEIATGAVAPGARLRLGRLAGAAGSVRINDHDCGWCWAPAWTVSLPMGLPAGTHRLELLLYPNTLNFFGPHHHLDGDLAVTSPGQFTGQKNFADRTDAPADTRVAAWHFRPWGVEV